jgi:hypothetical protein
MPYYPKSQILTDLFSNGEFVFVDDPKTSYVGYYWKNSTGLFYTGKNPQDSLNRQIILQENIDNSVSNLNLPFLQKIIGYNEGSDPYISSIENIPYNPNVFFGYENSINKNVFSNSKVFLPIYSPNIPTEQDYQIGEYRRYFCKKTNEIIYLEINKETYDKLLNQDPQIAFQLYLPFNLPWQLTGKKEDVYKTNRNITELTSIKLKLPMLSSYLKEDFTKYYRG